MKKQTFYLILIICILPSLFLSGCTKVMLSNTMDDEEDSIANKQKYVGIYSLSEIDYFTDHKLGLYKAAEYLGVDVQYLSSVGNDETAMKDYFERAISEEVDGIVLLGTAESCKDYIDAAAQKGIPTVLVEGDISKSNRIGVVSTNNFEAGRTGARIAVELLNEQGQVGILTQLNTNVHQDRVKGYKAVFDEYNGISVVSLKDTMFSFEKASEAVHEMMLEHPEIDLIVGTDYYGGPAAMIALDNMDIGSVKIVAMDKSSMTMEGIEDGKIDATLVQQTALMSFYALRLLYDYNNANVPIEWLGMSGTESAPIYIQTGVKIVTKNDIQ